MAGFTPPTAQVTPGPNVHGFAISPNDTTALTALTRAIYVGGAGDISLILAGDTAAVTFKAVPVGTTLDVCASLVKSTGTTATNLLGLY